MMSFRLLVISSLFSLVVSAQKESHIWYFGYNAGIDFNANPPASLSDGMLITVEGCASISNKNGRLLFYTDGSTIFSRNHVIMTNGSGLTGNSTSTQSGIIVQNPDSGNIYYVFTTYVSLAYSIVDTSLSGGMGAVRVKNINLLTQGTEKLTAVKHANGKDIWVVSHRAGPSDEFYVYLVTGAGVSNIPVISKAGAGLNMGSPGSASLGVIKLSPDGKTMVCLDYLMSTNSVQLLDFDNSTGKVNNARTLNAGQYYYGAEFSPSGRYLYVSRHPNGTVAANIDQYDVQAGTVTDIITSRKVIADSAAAGSPASIQLAPDGRMYIAQVGGKFLSVINYPDRPDTSCGFVLNGFNLTYGTCQGGLPTFNQSFFLKARVEINYLCYTDTTLLSLSDTKNLDSLIWYFGDTASPEKISRSLKAGHVYSSPGTYQGRVYLYRNALPYTDTIDFNVVIKPLPDVSLRPDTMICKGASVTLAVTDTGDNPAATIAWNQGLGSGSLKTVSPDTTTTYRIIADAGCTHYKDTDEVTVYLRPAVSTFLRPDTTICFGNSVVLAPVTTGGDSTYTHTWDNSLGTGDTRTVSPVNTTTYRVIADDGCTSGKDTDFVTVNVRPRLEVSLNKDTLICVGGSANLRATAKGGDSTYLFTWASGLGTGNTKTVSPLITTAYTVTLSDNCSPDVRDTVVVNVEKRPELQFFADSSVCIGELISFNNMSTGPATSYQYSWRFGDGKSSLLEDPDHAYDQQGLYTVTLVAAPVAGCIDSLVKKSYIRVHPDPVAAFKTNPAFTDIEHPSVSFINQSSGAVQYQWDFGDNSVSSSRDPQHTYTAVGSYPVALVAVSGEGCHDTAINIFQVNDVYHFYIPLSFSPNADGINDEFRYMGGGYLSVKMKVYNRWGEVVFASDKVNEYWNGGMNNTGAVLPEGVYTYIISVRDVSKGMHQYKGTVTLIR